MKKRSAKKSAKKQPNAKRRSSASPTKRKSADTSKKKPAKTPRKPAPNIMTEAFPMIAVIDEQIRTTIPPDLVAKVKSATSKKQIINPTYPYARTMQRAVYDRQIQLLQIELVKMQSWAIESGERIVLLFEGRDAAGKGGTIKRFTENLNPRGARVAALAKPTETERGQWYFQRYVENLPTKGEMVFFDRSWYNRAGVENVMGFCNPTEYLEFMRQAPEFERMLVRSDIRLFKFWFSVSREEQLRRFMSRAHDPLKQWKLSPIDVESLGRWHEYTKAKEDMLFVRSDDKKRARLNAMMFLLTSIPYKGKDKALLADLDPLIVGAAKDIYESGESVRQGGSGR